MSIITTSKAMKNKRMPYELRIGALLMISAVLTGCATQSQPQSQGYIISSPMNGLLTSTFTPPATVPLKDVTTLPTSIGINPIQTSGWLDSNKIIWSNGAEQLLSNDQHHWGDPLPNMLTVALFSDLQQLLPSNSKLTVGPWVRLQRPDKVISASVSSISVTDNQLSLNLSWSIQNKERGILYQQHKVYERELSNTDSEMSNNKAAESVPSASNFARTLSLLWADVATDMYNHL